MQVKYDLTISVKLEYSAVPLPWKRGSLLSSLFLSPEDLWSDLFLTQIKLLQFIVFQHHSDAEHP